jgi:lysozyme
MRSLAKIASLVVLLALAARAAYNAGVWRFQYPSHDRYPLRGIDVSHHQGAIDWRAVRADGIGFAYIKASEGGDFVDPSFALNWRATATAGIPHGAYHFFSLCTAPEVQANRFLGTVPREPSALPSALDLEFGGNCSAKFRRADLCGDVRTFVDRVETATGKPIVIYATEEFLAANEACLPKRALWVRSLMRTPSRQWQLWQFANRARVAGITGPVDLNVWAMR